ncbi:6-phosphofructokinase [Streptomyces fuscigenes]|uniref:6-phosphofructokinase n=1 Tax=Streptomyces fuscigenes TaxID=1528880 RepID=UPI001F15963D|nr:6-phosphofructokinase [Streptomyces fuscigenes]MCF3964793.1 6-phosphofructokinase [Streptomyces fuscigenes]
MRVGVLTGGGDCPGLNAVIRAIVRKGVQEHGFAFTGFRDGWRGLLDGTARPLDIASVHGILPLGGTIIGASRTNPLAAEDGVDRIRETLAREDVDALVVIGGEDTLGVANELVERHGIPCVGVPKTIDNDLSATDFTFGFDTAVGVATQAVDRLHTTADSHMRVLVCEVMGRHSGWIALHAGLAGGADAILVPERPFDVDQVCGWMDSRFRASHAPVVVISEGAKPSEGDLVVKDASTDSFGHVRLSGIGDWLAGEIEARTGHEARTTVLGHTQRGGTPSAFDRWLATRFGLHAVDAVRDGDFGTMVALHGTDIVRVPIADAVATLKTVPDVLYEEAGVFFG